MYISELINKLKDIVCNRMSNTDDALAVTDAIDILQVIDNAGITVMRTPKGITLTQEPIYFTVGARGDGKSHFKQEMAKLRATEKN